MISRITQRIKRMCYSPNLERNLSKTDLKTVRLGTKYGGWNFVPSLLRNDQWAMLCGAGEDISFDLALSQLYDAKVVIVDPTPRAVSHWEGLLAAKKNSGSFRDGVAGQFYDLEGLNLSKVTFVPYAIWNNSENLRFWEPADPDHVSYSATNLQETNHFIEVAALDPYGIAEKCGLDLKNLGLLKLDIEGAEGDVLDWFLDEEISVPQILVEFDEMTRPSHDSKVSVRRIVDRLLSVGYEMICRDGVANALFVRR